jgi:hypothetical protein
MQIHLLRVLVVVLYVSTRKIIGDGVELHSNSCPWKRPKCPIDGGACRTGTDGLLLARAQPVPRRALLWR